MQTSLRETAKKLLTSGQVAVVIGYEKGTAGRMRPVFIRCPDDVVRLVFNPDCRQNLATFLLKPEIKKMGRRAIVAPAAAIKTIQLFMAENQIGTDDIVIIAVDNQGNPVPDASPAAIDQLERSVPVIVSPEDRALLERLKQMTREERWEFWKKELSVCIKCFACRANCPMCYCAKCTVECNQPQWISVPSHAQGVLEWHIMRAMHMAGRCSRCGECSRACPLDIPIHLLNLQLADDIDVMFSDSGNGPAYQLSVFKPDDREDFIR